MLIYKQLGASAQNEFAKTWGVGYALNNASEWQDVAVTAFKAALLIVILDALRLTKNSSWFEGTREREEWRSAWLRHRAS
jgi:hypothetical protein